MRRWKRNRPIADNLTRPHELRVIFSGAEAPFPSALGYILAGDGPLSSALRIGGNQILGPKSVRTRIGALSAYAWVLSPPLSDSLPPLCYGTRLFGPLMSCAGGKLEHCSCWSAAPDVGRVETTLLRSSTRSATRRHSTS